MSRQAEICAAVPEVNVEGAVVESAQEQIANAEARRVNVRSRVVREAGPRIVGEPIIMRFVSDVEGA